jgi:hypothetical protein
MTASTANKKHSENWSFAVVRNLYSQLLPFLKKVLDLIAGQECKQQGSTAE